MINITHFNPTLKELQTRDLCASKASIPIDSIGLYGYPNATSFDLLWAVCPIPAPAQFSFKEPMWIAVWVIVAGETVLLLSWHLYKYFNELKYKRQAIVMPVMVVTTTNVSDDISSMAEKIKTVNEIDQVSTAEKEEDLKIETIIETSLVKEKEERLCFRGFKRDYFGLFCFGSIILITLLFVIFLGCIVGDYCK